MGSAITSGDLSEQSAGGGTARYKDVGVIHVSSPNATTTAVITEEDLWSWNLPANTLAANGDGLRITAFLQFGGNANSKTIRIYWGTTAGQTFTSTGNGSAVKVTMSVTRIGAASQWVVGEAFANGTTNNATFWSAPTLDLTAAQEIKVTGQNGVANAADVRLRVVYVEYLPAPPVT